MRAVRDILSVCTVSPLYQHLGHQLIQSRDLHPFGVARHPLRKLHESMSTRAIEQLSGIMPVPGREGGACPGALPATLTSPWTEEACQAVWLWVIVEPLNTARQALPRHVQCLR